jgi:hypothetical protein
LYANLVKHFNSNTPLQFEEAKEMYLKYGCREMRDGIPYTYNYWKSRDKDNNPIGGYEPMTENEIRICATHWIMHNIGSLVLKGYLKCIPQIEFGKIKIKELND